LQIQEQASKNNEQEIENSYSNQQLSKMIQDKINSAQNSALKKDEMKNINDQMKKLAAEKGVMRTSSYISRGSMHSQRMKDLTLDHPKVLSKSKHPIIRICLTGGPCAGKTTALATLNQVLTQLGFKVL